MHGGAGRCVWEQGCWLAGGLGRGLSLTARVVGGSATQHWLCRPCHAGTGCVWLTGSALPAKKDGLLGWDVVQRRKRVERAGRLSVA